jgi:quercetin dioxygenase-like cupin family protein
MPRISELKKKLLTEGIVGQYVHGDSTTLGWVTIKAGSKLPAHHHPHEQITLMLEGKMEMQIGDETFLLEPGVVKVIPANIPHSAIAHSDSVLIDVFSPVREDYRE